MCGKSRQPTRPLTQVPIHRAPEGGPASAPHPWPAVSSREKIFWRVRASAFQEKDSWSVFHGEVWVGGAGGTRHEDRELGTAVPWTPHCWTEISAAKLIKRVQWQRFLSSGISSSDVLSCLPLRELCQDAKGTREMVITVRHVGAYLSSQRSGGGGRRPEDLKPSWTTRQPPVLNMKKEGKQIGRAGEMTSVQDQRVSKRLWHWREPWNQPLVCVLCKEVVLWHYQRCLWAFFCLF